MAQNIDKLAFPGQVSINTLSITSSTGTVVNLLNVVNGIQIFEDLYGYTTGKIIISDALALTNVLPLQGSEVLELSIITPTMDKLQAIEGLFYVYNLGERTQDSDKSESYTLGFCTRDVIVSANKALSRAFSGKIDSLIESLISDERFLASELPFAIEPTSNSIKYVSNYWSPLKNIKFLAERAKSQKDNAPSYLFYQDRYGLNFKSLSLLYRQSPYQNVFIDHYTRDVASVNRDMNAEYSRALQWGFSGTSYDYLGMLESGALGSTLFSYDLLRKNYQTVKFDYPSSFAKTSHLNRDPLFGPNLVVSNEAKIWNMTRDYGSFTGWGDVTEIAAMQHRQSLLKQLTSNRIKVVMYGRTDYTVGQLMNVYKYANKPTDHTTKEILDTEVSGTYIVTAIEHFITVNKHECIIELSRDC